MKSRKKQEKPAPREKKDFWDSIADDVSSGYGADKPAKDREHKLLNEDQEPDDQERADK